MHTFPGILTEFYGGILSHFSVSQFFVWPSFKENTKHILGPNLMFAKHVRQDPGRAWQNTLARAGTNFTKPHTRIKFRPSTPRWSDLMCVHNAAKAALDGDGGRRSILFAANCW